MLLAAQRFSDGLTIFSVHHFEHLDIQGLVGDKTLQPRVLDVQLPQLLQFTQIHPAILPLPPMKGLGADNTRAPASGGDRLATLRPAHNHYAPLRGTRMSGNYHDSFQGQEVAQARLPGAPEQCACHAS